MSHVKSDSFEVLELLEESFVLLRDVFNRSLVERQLIEALKAVNLQRTSTKKSVSTRSSERSNL